MTWTRTAAAVGAASLASACAPETRVVPADESVIAAEVPVARYAVWGGYFADDDGGDEVAVMALTDEPLGCEALRTDPEELLYGTAGLMEGTAGSLVFFIKYSDGPSLWEGTYLGGGGGYGYGYEYGVPGEPVTRSLLIAPWADGVLFADEAVDGWAEVASVGASTVLGTLETDLLQGEFVADNCGDLGVDL